ncbi:probable sodium/potassium/calcium exchanger CG1090 [Drosophila novamexicana]|uniref:probable sodium/potassium/calcium exchanger CG1090 n=1 Tax=Drosophila novamexicana TaxID=47314 RepID=UPI0011E59FEA|nr:probable sodium/potassium/calcium exchanger CG1090 [Drosophila novamexicana]XP_030562678.1 probable sodium/potassium/calcium exchanger CG1090 [Drosophila novamexicana]
MIVRHRSRRARMLNMGLLFLIYYCVSIYSARGQDNKPDIPLDVGSLPEAADADVMPESESSTPNYFLTSEASDAESGTTAATPMHGAVPTWRPRRDNCTPPAIEQFPQPLMNKWARQHGGLILHILVAIYTFFGLAIVCDEYFVASLDRLCEELKLSPDVAGATFMAAGSSAPELATVVIGVFFAKDDIGISGVIGSAVFNIMFVISVCALCSGTVCQLNWWPLVRDCFFYCVSILVMLIIIFNDVISCAESVVMLLCYVLYCIALHFNTELERWALGLNLPFKLPSKEEQSALVTYKNVPESSYTQGTQQKESETSPQQQAQPSTQGDYQSYNDPNASWDPNAAWGEEGQSQSQPTAISVKASQPPAVDDWGMSQFTQGQGQENMGYHADQPEPVVTGETAPAAPKTQVAAAPAGVDYYKSTDKQREPRPDPLLRPTEGGMPALVSWYVVYPIHFLCKKTMPDCRQLQYRNWYPFTFLISMVWISFYSYFMVWMITVIGSTLAIPDTVMGLTFVAAGVSVPDALSSIAVIKEGYGDMAVSNAIGSNVFDILVCLGLPWFIQTAIIKPGSHVNVISKGLAYSTLSLFSTVVFLILSTHLNGWKLDKRLGIILMIWYLFFITLAALYEMNVFGYMNPPECPSTY